MHLTVNNRIIEYRPMFNIKNPMRKEMPKIKIMKECALHPLSRVGWGRVSGEVVGEAVVDPYAFL